MRKKRSLPLLGIAFLALAGILFLTYFSPPTGVLQLSFFSLSPLIPLSVLVFIFVYGILMFLFSSRVHATLGGWFVVSLAFLRINNYTYPFFVVLLIAFFLLLELLFYYRK